jgi:hypothetical protein
MRLLRLAMCALTVSTLLIPCPSVAQEIGVEQRPPQDGQPRHDSSATPFSGGPGRGPRVDHAPAFAEPFVGTYETPTTTGQFGLSGWTTANPPLGPPYRDVTGWFSFGFTLTWDPKPATVTR